MQQAINSGFQKAALPARTQGYETPARDMISAVPQPSAVARTIVPPHMLLGIVAIGHDCLQPLPIAWSEPDFDTAAHPGLSHTLYCRFHCPNLATGGLG